MRRRLIPTRTVIQVMSTPTAVAAPAASTARLTVTLLGVMLAMLRTGEVWRASAA